MKMYFFSIALLVSSFLSAYEDDANVHEIMVCSNICHISEEIKIYSYLILDTNTNLLHGFCSNSFFHPDKYLNLEEARKVFYFYHLFFNINETNYVNKSVQYIASAKRCKECIGDLSICYKCKSLSRARGCKCSNRGISS